jgi:hypothetical protein
MALVVKRIGLEADQEVADRNYRHTYEVQVDTLANAVQTVVLNAAGIPSLGAVHPNDPSAVVTSKSARLREERLWKLWTVVVNYAVQVGEGDVITRPPDQPPDLWVPELRVRTATQQREIIEDLDGQILRNTAQDMFPAHMRMIVEYYSVVSYRRWYRTVDFSPVAANKWLAGKVNESAWYEAAEREAQIQSVTSEREVWTPPTPGMPAQVFFRVDFEIAIREGGWQLSLPNEGLHTRSIVAIGAPPRQPILLDELNDDGNPTGLRYKASEPVPLNFDGSDVLEDGMPVIQLDYRVYDDRDFAAAGL